VIVAVATCAHPEQFDHRFLGMKAGALRHPAQVSARLLHREFFTFRPEFKLWIRGNHSPAIRGADEGIWRRIHLIPLEVQIPEAERALALPAKLRAELPGILRSAVEGAIAWKCEGLSAPEKVKSATGEYRTEMDRLADFIAEKCATGP
jgi:putative DNA primase/helicase